MDAIINISNFGDSDINGTYYYDGLANGYDYWKKDDNTYLIYKSNWMPWSDDGNYYLVRSFVTNDNSIQIERPKYKKSSTNLFDDTEWVALMEVGSGEKSIGNLEIDYLSSSSSSSSSNSI
jgi:hypothetical protein